MKRNLFLLFFILCFAVVIRLWRLGDIPPGVNRDEASIGYTAYSLLQTGKDEYSTQWPLSIKSFGDWKLPLYIYASMVPIKLFGLSDFSVRIISVLAGSLTVVATYFLVIEFLKTKNFIGNWKLEIRNSKSIALLSAMLLAISPWHIHFSRVASEANLAVLLTVLALWLLFISFRKPAAIMGSAVLFALTLYTYHGNHVFTPLILLGTFIFYRKQLFSNRYIFPSLGLLIIFSVIIYAKTFLYADKTKLGGTSILSDTGVVLYQIELPRGLHATPLSAKVFHNRFVYVGKRFIESYVLSYSPEFLFIRGGGNNAHNIPLAGNAYLLELPFLFLGIYRLIKMKQKSGLFFLWWLAVAPIPSSLTRDAPHSARMLAVLPALQVVMAFGIHTIFDFVRRQMKLLVGVALAGAYVWSILFYFDAYFVHFPQTNSPDWGVGYQAIARFLTDNEKRFDRIIINKPDYSPYIFLAFYQRLDPLVIQKTAIRYPETQEGFSHVSKLGKIEFRRPVYPDDLLVPGQLVIDWESAIPAGMLSVGRIEKKITTLGGNPQFILLSSNKDK